MIQPGRGWWLTASGMALVAVCYGLARFAYGLFVPAIRTEFALSDTLLGSIAAGSYAAYCVAVLGSAAAVSRWGPRVTATAAGVLAAGGMTLVALSPNVGLLVAGVVLAGGSTGVASPPLAAAVALHVPIAWRDRAQAIVNAGPGVGIAVSGLLAVFALGQWRVAWAFFAITAVVVTVAVATALPRATGVGRTGERASHGLLVVARVRCSWVLAIGAALFGFASSAVWTFGRDHVVQSGGMTLSNSVVLWIVLGVAELIGVCAGDLVRRWGLHWVWSGSLVLLALSSAVLGLFAGSSPFAIAAIAVFGGSYVFLTIAVFLWAVRLHPEHTAAAVAFGFLAISAGQAIAGPLVGVVVEHAGAPAAFVACAAVGVSAALLRAPMDRYSAGPTGHPVLGHDSSSRRLPSPQKETP